MDKKLLDKEVIALFDIRQIQRFIFQVNKTTDTVGAGALVELVLLNAFRYAAEHIDPPLSKDEYAIGEITADFIPYFDKPSIKMQALGHDGGNATVLFKSGAICEKVCRMVSWYFLEYTGSLEVVVAVAENTGNIAHDTAELYRKLEKIKFSRFSNVQACPLPIIEVEEATGKPVVAVDDFFGDKISRDTKLFREAAGKLPSIERLHTLDKNNSVGNIRVVSHIDGNSLGIFITKMTSSTPDYREGIISRVEFSQNIKTATNNAIKNAFDKFYALCSERGLTEKQAEQQVMVLSKGGDDLNIEGTLWGAVNYVRLFIESVKGSMLYDKGGIKMPYSVCAGLAITDSNVPVLMACDIAEQCCGNAKKIAKLEENLVDGLPGNWIDFQVCLSPSVQNLESMRKTQYMLNDETSLLRRPYSFEEKHKDNYNSYYSFEKNLLHFLSDEFTFEQKTMLMSSYMKGESSMMTTMNLFEKRGLSIPEDMGSAFIKNKDGDKVAAWYDALGFALLLEHEKREGNITWDF